MIESSFPCPSFGPVNRERNLNYSWPEEIRGLNSAREKRRAHMKAVMWREQVLLDDVDAKTLGNDACVLELTLSKRRACEVFAAAVKTIKRVRRLMLDSGCGIDLIGLGDFSREEKDLIVQNAKVGKLDLDMPREAGQGSQPPAEPGQRSKPNGPPPPPKPPARDLKAEAKSIRHLMTHLPKNPYCDACQRAKMENVKSFRQDSPRDKGFEKFGEHVTVDTMVLHGLGNRGNNGEADAVVFYDLATSWLEAVPVKGRTNSDTLRTFQQMFGRLDDLNAFSMDVERRYAPPEIREIYCDKAREFISVCKRVGISVAHSTPGMPRTNAIVES